MSVDEFRHKLISVCSLCTEYCAAVENAAESEKDAFVVSMLSLLPRIYVEFLEMPVEELPEADDFTYFQTYVDEDYYDSVRLHIESLLGPDDVFLETFEEDMKYSDTPVAASVSESLADIFQPLFNFISVVRDTDGEQAPEAFRECRENFEAYWGQTLCNVMRPLNHICFASSGQQ